MGPGEWWVRDQAADAGPRREERRPSQKGLRADPTRRIERLPGGGEGLCRTGSKEALRSVGAAEERHRLIVHSVYFGFQSSRKLAVGRSEAGKTWLASRSSRTEAVVRWLSPSSSSSSE
ncbi:hypothetical protein VTO42DRAFT_3653 [Malbranchea cinnamomea]